VAVFLGILASALLNLEALGVSIVGDIPSGLPTPKLPDLSLVSQLWAGALGIALMSFIESNAAGRSFLRKGEPPINANQELVALGIANIGSSLFQGYAGGGGTSITAVNRNAGAKTQLTSIIIVITVILTLLFLASVIGLLPQATLGAMVMMAAAGLISIESFREIRRIRNTEFIWALIAFLGVVLLGTLEGILIAVLISILTLFIQSSFPPVYALGRKPGTDVFRPLSPDHPDDETFPGLLMVRTEGRMNFSSAPNATAKFLTMIEGMELQVIAIDFSAIPDLEYTALENLEELDEQLNSRGIELWLTALNPEPLNIIRRSSLGEVMGDERLFFNMEQAVDAYQKLDKEK
jgi:MFS superfamily sulfate permease-like transporter